MENPSAPRLYRHAKIDPMICKLNMFMSIPPWGQYTPHQDSSSSNTLSGFFVLAFENNHSHRSYFRDQVHSLAHWRQVKTRMPTTAREFQVVLSTIKEWYLLSFHALLMNGQLAIEDASYNLEPYVFKYCLKQQLFGRIASPYQEDRSIRLQLIFWFLER